MVAGQGYLPDDPVREPERDVSGAAESTRLPDPVRERPTRTPKRASLADVENRHRKGGACTAGVAVGPTSPF